MASPVILPAIISGAAALGSSLFGSHAAKSAASTQSDAAAKALAEQKRIFDIRESQNAPYLAASQDALTHMQSLAAMQQYRPLPPAYGAGYHPQTYFGGAPTAPPPGPGPAPGTPAPPPPAPMPGDFVTVMAPNKQIGRIPRAQLQKALDAGAVQVNQ